MPVFVFLFVFLFSASAATKKAEKSPDKDEEEVWSLDETETAASGSFSASLKKKKWGLKFGHAVNFKAAVGSRSVLSHSVSGQYKYSKNLFFSAATAYSTPLGCISDKSPYGFTDTSLTALFPLNFPESFLAEKWSGGLGISIPTSYQTRKSGKWFSLFGRASHPIVKVKTYSLSGNHILYAGFARYISDISGFHPNSLVSSAHSLNFSYKYKRVSFAALGRLYLSLSLKRESDISLWQRIRFRGSQGVRFMLSYIHPRPHFSIFGQTGVNVPFISPVLTGSPLANQYWSHLIGVGWKI